MTGGLSMKWVILFLLAIYVPDILPQAIVVLGPLVILLWMLKIIASLTSSLSKGEMGERIVIMEAESMLNEDKYHLINDVTLRTEDGTTQIDHIIVSVYGVFVVETKNMAGWIFGNPKQDMDTSHI